MHEIKNILQKRYVDNDKAVEHYSGLLNQYIESKLAPPHIVSELSTGDDGKYWSHIWEAILYNLLKSKGVELIGGNVKKSGQKGPDFGFKFKNKTIWIEAIVPSPEGIPAECLEPPDLSENKVYSVPHEQKLLRWTAAIKEKKDKIKGYLNKGIISQIDSVVIAVNSCRLQHFAFDDTGVSGFPYAVEATFPVGPLAIPLTREGKVAGPTKNSIRKFVINKNDAKVPTDNFLNEDYSCISAVMGSYQNSLWNNGLEFSLVHNPMATNKMNTGILGASKEFICQEKDNLEYLLYDILDSNEE